MSVSVGSRDCILDYLVWASYNTEVEGIVLT